MINLTTKLKAYPRMEPSILKNYYTKDQTQEVINQSLEGYVKEVENPVDGVIYGRSLIDGDVRWVNILGMDTSVLFNISNETSSNYPSVNELSNNFHLAELTIDPKTYNIQTAIDSIGYLWICSTKEISKVEFIAGDILHVETPITFIKTLDVPIDGSTSGRLAITFYCYRTTSRYIPNNQQSKWVVKVN